MAGGQAGIIIGTPKNSFTLTSDVRWVPYDGAAGAMQYGGMLTYYVSFVDLN